MSATELHIQCRRQLPTAPISNLNHRGVSGEVRSRARSLPLATEFTRSQAMDARPKKRLTPEVVAALLSMDLGSDGYSSTPYRGLSDVQISRKSNEETATPSQDARMYNSKSTSGDNTGMVEIVKSRGQPLGFSLREGCGSHGEKPGGIFVSRLTAGGIVEQNSLLHTGDEILEVNYVPVHGYKLSDVVAMIQLPKRLALKVRFEENPHQNTAGRQKGFNNNNCIYDDDRTGKIRCSNNKRTGTGGTRLVQRQMGTYGQMGTSTEGVSDSRSPGRILPAPPESEENKTRHEFEDSSTSILSKPNSSKISTEMLRTGPRSPNQAKDTNLMLLNQKRESSTVCAAKHKNRRRSAVLPVSENENTPTSQIVGKPFDGCTETGNVRGKRVDPGDIRFDIVPSSGASFGTGVISRTVEEVKAERDRDSTPNSSPVAFRSPKNSSLQTFDSNSSLSSSDSPKSPYKGPFRATSQENTGLPRSDLRAHSSVDTSPVSSSTETEDRIFSKNTSSDGSKQHKPPSILHALSSGELIPSHNNWFSKIGNQTRKHVRKFSEGTPPRPPSDGEVYRLQEPTDITHDGLDPGYRPYSGSSACDRDENKRSSRAVTGMLALHVVKGCRISTGEAASKDKRKKIKVFCAVDCDGIRQACTGTKKGSNNFQWNESFEIIFQRTREINITVCVRSKKDGDQTLSHGCLCLAQLLSEGGEHLLAVSLDPVGTLYVRLQFTDMKLLLQRTPSQRKEGVFGFSLDAVLRRENSRIPVLVRKCVNEINCRGLDVTGIYRLCGNAAKKRALRAEFENSSANVDLGQSENLVDVNVITGLLKDYLRELPNPLLSEEVREILYQASATLTQDESSQQLLVNEITKKFSSASKDTIACLLDHFATVLMHSDINKMNSHNLAVCIGPVLLSPSLGATSNDTVSDTKKDISAIKLLLEMWPKPEQVSAC